MVPEAVAVTVGAVVEAGAGVEAGAAVGSSLGAAIVEDTGK